jgi:hypothetical protein
MVGYASDNWPHFPYELDWASNDLSACNRRLINHGPEASGERLRCVIIYVSDPEQND